MSLPKVRKLDDILEYYKNEYCCLKYEEVEYNSFIRRYNVYAILVGDYDISFLQIENSGEKLYRCVDYEGNAYDYTDINQMFEKLDSLIWDI